MMRIEDIPVERIDEFWALHFDYLVSDGIIFDAEDKAHFQSDEYRLAIRAHMDRSPDRHHLIYFVEGGKRIGAASYCTYHSEDGKCLVCDFWVFPPFRGNGTGHRCFEALKRHTAADGALYYEINCDGRDDRMRFWKSNGFIENGVDEYGIPLLVRR